MIWIIYLSLLPHITNEKTESQKDEVNCGHVTSK